MSVSQGETELKGEKNSAAGWLEDGWRNGSSKCQQALEQLKRGEQLLSCSCLEFVYLSMYSL